MVIGQATLTVARPARKPLTTEVYTDQNGSWIDRMTTRDFLNLLGVKRILKVDAHGFYCESGSYQDTSFKSAEALLSMVIS